MNCEVTRQTARKWMDEYGLKDWSFGFDRALRRVGHCSFIKKKITLSVYFVMSNHEDEVNDTILHEIAHALVGIKRVPGRCNVVAHGHEWRAMCRQIGANPKRCCDSMVTMPKGRYVAYCPNCGQEFRKYRLRVKNIKMRWCAKCGRKRGELHFDYV